MTENEAIKVLEKPTKHIKISILDGEESICYSSDMVKAFETAIHALSEIQEYRAIGTVEEIQSMKDQLLMVKDMCKDYYEIGTIDEFKALKEKNEPKKTNSFSGCICNNIEMDWDFMK